MKIIYIFLFAGEGKRQGSLPAPAIFFIVFTSPDYIINIFLIENIES